VVESGSLVFILALAGVGFSILRRPEAGPTAFWTWGCFALFGSGLCTFILAEFRWSLPVGHAMATAYPVFLLAGALVYAERDMPRWLLPVALALGFGRGLLAMVGLEDLSHGIALVVEPTAALAGAAYVSSATRGGGASVWQRALAPALVLMAGMEAASAVWMSSVRLQRHARRRRLGLAAGAGSGVGPDGRNGWGLGAVDDRAGGHARGSGGGLARRRSARAGAPDRRGERS
jgi:hypothetical protein